MTQYRVVCTLDTEHGDGKKQHYDMTDCWCYGKPHRRISENFEDALKVLEIFQQECPEFDRKTAERFQKNPRDSIKYTQSNIRIVSREVTDWK